MKQKIYIADVKFVKSGSHNNKQWTLSHVVDQHGNRYGTFSGNKYEAMKGTEVEIEYTEEPSGKVNPRTGENYVNRSIIEPKRANVASPELEKRVAELEAIVKDLMKAIGVNTPAKTKEEFMASLKVDEQVSPKEAEVDVDSIPF